MNRGISALLLAVFAMTVSVKHVSARRRIRIGADAPINLYPYHAMVYRGSGHCGGSILSEYHVLTAAHCVTDENGTRISPTMFSVKYGTSIDNDGSGTIVDVSDIRAHEDHDSFYNNNDIAVAITEIPIELSEVAKIAKLGKNPPVVGQSVIVTGNGGTEFGLFSDKLLTTTIPITDFNECQKKHFNTLIEKNVACMLHKTRRTCYGDSGGPIMEFDSFQTSFIQVGLVSIGKGYGNITKHCPPPLGPTVMTKVASYQAWINNVTGNATTWVDN